MIETIQKTMEVPKEMNDVVVLVQSIFTSLKKKDTAALQKILENLPQVMAAIDGYEKLEEEAKSKYAANAYALVVSAVADFFLNKEEEQVEA